ncbi:hypothetical protein N9242_01640 [Vicingaceae bacterium]|nr:hypothetical protein [Vicingaceae bacterium]
MKNIFFLFLLIPFLTSAQVVDEVVQIDTTFETLKVIYKPENSSSYYFKKVAVFADDTSQIAVEKSYTNYGQNGIYKVYYPNGRLKLKTVYANSKIYGEWTHYDPEGKILIKGKYKEGLKHGYWIYKYLNIYGRYKKGYKHKRWVRKDDSENRYVSHYSMGKLKAGEGFGSEIPSYLNTIKDIFKKKNVGAIDTNLIVSENIDTLSISREYAQAISFLTENWMFRKALKKHFGTSLKKSMAIKKTFGDDERFNFVISPNVEALVLEKFFEENQSGEIVVPAIAELLIKKSTELKEAFSGEKVKEEKNLYNNSSDKESSMVVTFSEVKYNLLRLDVNWTFKEETKKFQILLYYNNKGVLKGAEYQKP